MLDLTSLNSEQYAAATSIDGPLMVLAGAGTGKTRVITYRIAYMLNCGIQPEQIVALSFTNKASKEMTERVKELVGARAKKVWLGTFHSFCLSILRRFPAEAGLSPRFSIADMGDQVDLVRKALEENKWNGLYQAEQLHSQISAAKNNLLSPEDIANGSHHIPDTTDISVLAAVYNLYERQLLLNRVIDFDDCIYKTVRLLKNNPLIQERLEKEYQYLMVDEFQDTNSAQLAIMEMIGGRHKNVCVVGDDDQSIYSWRGAMYEILEKFEETFSGTKMIKLEQNYRCSNVILSAANKVITNNTRRKDKVLWSESKENSPIEILNCEDDGKESAFVTEKCLSLMGAGSAPKDIAVLYRANNLARHIELGLKEARIPYKTYGGQSFFERKEVKDFISYLRLVLNPSDHMALWRIINTPNRGIGLKTLEKIEEYAHKLKKPPSTVLTDPELLATVRTDAVQGFADLIESYRAMPLNSAADAEELCRKILKTSGMENEIRAKSDNAAVRERKLENLRGLPNWISTIVGDHIANHGYVDYQALLDSLSLDNDKKEDQKGEKNHVSLMTIHAAKGLEFLHVFVVGVEEDILPHKNSVAIPASVCEERRLFYVALTRAKINVYLSWCLERKVANQKLYKRPSRFIEELPKETYLAGQELQRAKATTTEGRKEKTVARLGQLRALLKPT